MNASRFTATGRPTLLYAVKQLELAVRSQLDEVLKPYGVTTTQYTALTVLDHRGDVTSAALARRSFVTAQTMGDVVTALERQGLIQRHADPAHRRRLTITLTATGHVFLEKVRHAIDDVEVLMTQGISPDSVELFRGLLRSCLVNLSQPGASREAG